MLWNSENLSFPANKIVLKLNTKKYVKFTHLLLKHPQKKILISITAKCAATDTFFAISFCYKVTVLFLEYEYERPK